MDAEVKDISTTIYWDHYHDNDNSWYLMNPILALFGVVVVVDVVQQHYCCSMN